jgi:hypothetical protein
LKVVIGPDQVYFHFNDVFMLKFFFKICFGGKDPSKKGILELFPSGGLLDRYMPKLALLVINGDSAGNYYYYLLTTANAYHYKDIYTMHRPTGLNNGYCSGGLVIASAAARYVTSAATVSSTTALLYRELPLHGRGIHRGNGYSAGNYQLMDDKFT